MSDPGFRVRLDRARAGSESAWSDLLRDLTPRLVGFFRSRGASDPEALTGDVYMSVARSIGSFEGDQAGFHAWVFTIAHRRWVDERRRAQRRVAETPVESVEALPVETPSAEEEALEHTAAEDVEALLEMLTEDQRDVITLRVVAGLSLAETAEAIGKRIGAVKALQRRGLAALQKILTTRIPQDDFDDDMGDGELAPH